MTNIMRSLVLVSMLFVAQTALAQVSISEIKYTGNEWIEISNSGTSVDLSLYKFFEGGTNHKLKSVQGGALLAPGWYAVIANDATAFLNEHGGFSGMLFDSSFSLLDAGETISIKSSDTNAVDTVSYAGIKGSKNSAQKIAGIWREATPTPGVSNEWTAIIPAQESAMSTAVASANPTSISPSFPVEPQIIADAGASTRIVSAGAPATFMGRVFGLKKEPIENARMVWSFGDGGRAEGVSVAHTYYYPGEYIAVFDAASGYYSASDRIAVRVVAPSLALHTGGDENRSFIAIENHGGDEVDLSLWQIESAGKTFILPQSTILGARKTLTLASEVTGLAVLSGSIALLHFPNGTRIETQGDKPLPPIFTQATRNESVIIKQTPRVASLHDIAPQALAQEAAVANALVGTASSSSTQMQESGSLWRWYSGAALLGALALLGLRFTRGKKEKISTELTADDFEIIEDDENSKKGDIF
ncbi:MAG: lamin tail domain-containing protein [Candidatus Yonathbacteria bacterium]|nr:lamin tail domain-containing protein [Candidatus Yonathbacteria bacterium]